MELVVDSFAYYLDCVELWLCDEKCLAFNRQIIIA